MRARGGVAGLNGVPERVGLPLRSDGDAIRVTGLREKNKAKRRAAILDAAVELLNVHPWHEVTTLPPRRDALLDELQLLTGQAATATWSPDPGPARIRATAAKRP